MPALIVVFALIGVAAVSSYALIIVLFESIRALVIVAPPALAGLWLVPLLRLGGVPLRWHLLIGATLGIGACSLLVLLLGLAGVLQRGIWVALLIGMTVAGVARLGILLRVGPVARPGSGVGPASRPVSGPSRFLPLILAPFLSFALLAAPTAPGLIWREEGYGYDVLEYHLQVPREYAQAGRIEYLPHNVYANFPANVEMLYLLAMVVHGDPVETGVTANMIHLLLAVLTVCAAWVAGREWSPRAGLLAATAIGTTGWLPYLSGMAYVENGMLLFGMVATAAIARVAGRGADGRTDDTGHIGWIALAGLCAGLACGCKYTAVPLIAAPLAVAAVICRRRGLRDMAFTAAVFGCAALLTVLPWLVKNRVMTGNPVFPLASNVFPSTPPGWDDASAEQWNRGHTPKAKERTAAARLHALWRHVPGDAEQRFGPAILLLPLVGLLGRRLRTVDGVLCLVLATHLVVWFFFTHLYARFAVVMLIPLALLAGRALGPSGGSWRPVAATIVVLLGALWNVWFVRGLHARENSTPLPASAIYAGQIAGYEYFRAVNEELPSGAKLLLVGEARAFYFLRDTHYHVVFNRNPLAETIRKSEDVCDVIAWLRENGYTHVLVNWSEVARLSKTYGYPAEIEPALFDQWQSCGLRLVRSFTLKGVARYVELYEVPRS